MKKIKLIVPAILTISLLGSCANQPSLTSSSSSSPSVSLSSSSSTSSSSSSTSVISSSTTSSSSSSSSNITPKEKIINLLNNINTDEITAYNFTDRSYSYNFYNDSKYVVSGNISTGIVNYKATHKFKLFSNDVITDNISVDALDGVENTKVVSNTKAKGQIYLSESYIFDYFICNSMKDQSYVECHETDYYTNLNTYFNYLTIISDVANAFQYPEEFFPTESGYEEPIFNYSVSGNIEHYEISTRYPGSEDYKPIIVNYEVDYNSLNNEFVNINYKQRSMLNSLDTDFEIGTSSITAYSISNLTFGEKIEYTDSLYTFDDIQEKDNIHNAPAQIIDISNKEDGLLDEETTFEIVNNIYAYSNDIRQTNYSMTYHNAFDFATTDRTEFGDARFEGKIIAYNGGITDNNGTIQLLDSKDQPVGEKSDFRIFTKAESYGIFRGGKFSKYITSAFAFTRKSLITNTRELLDANPLYWSEISSIYSDFSTYGLGQTTFSNGSKINISVSGNKLGSSLEIKAQIHASATGGTNVENIDSFTFIIEDNKLTAISFQTSGSTSSGKYVDTYEAKFVHATKQDFKGEEMNILEELNTQISMEDFAII